MNRETIEVDVVYVGAGPASLSSALYLKKLVRSHNEKVEKEGQGKKIESPQIIILEKGSDLGAHTLSGAVMDPRALDELFPNKEELSKPIPFECEVTGDNLYFLTSTYKMPILFTPPSMHNKGMKLVSLGKFIKWMGEIAQEEEIEIFTGFPGVMLLEENGKIVGVRTGDAGVDKEGKPKPNFQPGIDIRAKVTVLAEGTRGHLTKQLVKAKGLDKESNPMCYATGVKELWELPDDRFPAGKVVHTMGWPLTFSQFGGSFMYGLPNRKVAIGFVVGLDYKDPFTDPHRLLQTFKKHPFVSSILEGGKLERYGAKTIPEGGYWAIPKTYGDGFMIIGDAAGMVNVMRLKGIHLSMKSGMLAAETLLAALEKEEFGEATLSDYSHRIEKSWIQKELWKVRNFRQSYHSNLLIGMFHTGLQIVTGGRGLWGRYKSVEDFKTMKKRCPVKFPNPPPAIQADKKLTFDKLTSVFYSGSTHEENQPCHLQVKDTAICTDRCTQEYGNPCQYFCPAQVYEMVDGENGQKKLQINFSNCVHCKTCDIMDPYELITWVSPEGQGGPRYNIL